MADLTVTSMRAQNLPQVVKNDVFYTYLSIIKIYISNYFKNKVLFEKSGFSHHDIILNPITYDDDCKRSKMKTGKYFNKYIELQVLNRET